MVNWAMEGKNLMLYNVSFLFLAITVVLGTVQPASANISEFTDNFVHVTFQNPIPSTTTPPDFYDFDPVTGPNIDPPLGLPEIACDVNFLCTLEIPNFIDELNTKIIEIAVVYEIGAPLTIVTPSVTCFDPTHDQGQDPGTLIYEGSVNSAIQTVYYEFECRPNPDSETIIIQLDSNVILVEIWTKSFNDQPVGGTFIPIDQSALLLAGVQSISMWMIPVVIAGIGIGVFVIKRRN